MSGFSSGGKLGYNITYVFKHYYYLSTPVKDSTSWKILVLQTDTREIVQKYMAWDISDSARSQTFANLYYLLLIIKVQINMVGR